MIISGLEIKNMLNKEIFIEPFDDSRLNPNSYNLRLHNELLVYDRRSDVWEYIYMSPPVSEMWVFRVIGLWKYLVFNRYGYIRMSKYVKYFIIRF